MQINPVWKTWGTRTLVVLLIALVTYLATGKKPEPQIDPLPDEPIFVGAMGWENRPADVVVALGAIEQAQGFRPVFATCAAGVEDRTDDPVFFWEAERKVLGAVQASWNQGQVGSCVSFGWGRGINDLILIGVAAGDGDYPGQPVATEPIYGGSRVEVGGGRIRGDGSVGAWAGQWVSQRGGVLFRKVYGQYDLTTYSEQRCRQWGATGVPDDLEPEAKKHPVQSVALVKTAEEAWSAIGNGYPVPVCSNVGFQSPLRNGFCEPSGTWAHCMVIRGRFVHPTRGSCFVIQNSWGDYLKASQQNRMIEVQGGQPVELPEGCFATTAAVVDLIVKQGDSFAISGFKGFPRRKIDWLIRGKPPQAHGELALVP